MELLTPMKLIMNILTYRITTSLRWETFQKLNFLKFTWKFILFS